jgi:glutathione synthase/RimK-type ligase-like ATP-grasp enzyme
MIASERKDSKRIVELIELSLGPRTSFAAIRNKSDFLTLAAAEGLRCPNTSVVPADRAFEPAQSSLIYPIVAKADQSDGGRSVRIVRRQADLRAAVWELQTPCTWRGRRFFGAMLGSEALGRFKLPLRRTINLQDYIVGRPGNRAVVCWKGKVLAGISVEAVEVTHEYGPASVVRIIDHPEMTAACERIVERLQLSGFVGFDFVLDSANQAWLLEMNPRITQTCHFVLADGTNLAAALCAQMTGRPARSRPVVIYRDMIALFPNETLRAPAGKYLKFCRHDVPWDEPELVRCILNQELRIGIGKRVRLFLEHRFPPIVEALVRIGLVGARAGYSPPYLEDVTPPV